jgi:hypothetical protein
MIFFFNNFPSKFQVSFQSVCMHCLVRFFKMKYLFQNEIAQMHFCGRDFSQGGSFLGAGHRSDLNDVLLLLRKYK